MDAAVLITRVAIIVLAVALIVATVAGLIAWSTHHAPPARRTTVSTLPRVLRWLRRGGAPTGRHDRWTQSIAADVTQEPPHPPHPPRPIPPHDGPGSWSAGPGAYGHPGHAPLPAPSGVRLPVVPDPRGTGPGPGLPGPDPDSRPGDMTTWLGTGELHRLRELLAGNDQERRP